MWSARAVDLIEDKVPLEIVWNGAEIYNANLMVPKGDPNAKAAWEFCNFVAQAKPQADFAMLLPYGPANPGARALMTEARLQQTRAGPTTKRSCSSTTPPGSHRGLRRSASAGRNG